MGKIVTYVVGETKFEVEVGSPLHERLVQQKLLEGSPGAAPAPVEPAEGDFDVAKASIPKVIEHVNGDPVVAAAVLEAEKARGEDARATLVGQLQAIIDAD